MRIKITTRLYLFAFFLTISSLLYSQALPDSVRLKLQASNDSSRVETYIQLAEAVMTDDSDAALDYMSRASKIAEETSDPILIGKAKNKTGVAYYYREELDVSTRLYFEALTLFDSVNYFDGKVRALNNIAWNYRIQDRHEESIEMFLQALAIAEALENQEILQTIYNNLGTAYRNTGENQEALQRFRQSLAINEQLNNKKWKAYNLNNIGLIHTELENYQEAKSSFFQARDLNLELENQEEYVKNLLNIGKVYSETQSYDSAEMYLDFAFPIIESSEHRRIKLTYFEYKADLYERTGNFKKALEFHKQFVEIEKELKSVELSEQLSKLQARYNDAQKARELKESEAKVSRQRMVIFGGTALFFLLLGILILVLNLYKSKNRWAKNISKLNDEIRQKNEELSTMNEEVQSINDRLESLVEERTKKIKDQNEKLVKYAFINSHEIRGPLARVLGLVYLLSLEHKHLTDQATFKLLSEAAEELDAVIGESSSLLDFEDLEKDVEKSRTRR